MITIILALYFTGLISQETAITFLYVIGLSLLIAEIGVVSFGLLAFNGLVALFAAYSIQTGTVLLFGLPVDWNIVFGIGFVEFALIVGTIAIHAHLRNLKTDTGKEGMIGAKATVLDWSGKNGQVRLEGEIWKASSSHRLDLSPNDEVTIEAVEKLKLIVRP
ncbi:MAG: hypothetical protein KDI90_04560 [Alphaproteobacteria bacterium]|nr:hypothetical protein [Alphaproteobacteria bacterium]MCB9974845.1 hypothetical protein [Rhodospirillales bacterium]